MATAQDFADAAYALVGTPWHHQGRVPGVGIDCAGVVACAAMACGIVLQDVRDYTLPASPALIERMLASSFDRDAEPVLGVGRVLLFRIGREPQHMAVAIGGGKMVHGLDRKRRAVVVDRLDEVWGYRLHSTWRLRGVSY